MDSPFVPVLPLAHKMLRLLRVRPALFDPPKRSEGQAFRSSFRLFDLSYLLVGRGLSFLIT